MKKILGLLDLITAVVFALLLLGIKFIPEMWLVFLASYLIIKAIVFLTGKDVASAVDLLVGVYFMAFVFLNFSFIIFSLISLFWLGQKAFMSFTG